MVWRGFGAAFLTIAVLSGGSEPAPTRNPLSPDSIGGSSRAARTTLPSPTAERHRSASHIMVIMMENKNYSEVIGQADQPYTNALAQHYGLATQSFAFGHPSLPNYLVLVSGSSQGVTDDDAPSAHSFPRVATLADQLAAAGFSEKAYAEDLPPDPSRDSGEYAVRHFPWAYFPSTKMPIADSTSLVRDLNSSRPPDFVWYTPNLIDDEHDGTVQEGDAFLARLVPKVQSTAWYKSGGEIIIEWDESDTEDSGFNGTDGGHIPTIVVSNALKASPRKDTTPVDTAGILASIEDSYAVGHLGGAANAANGNINPLLAAGRPARRVATAAKSAKIVIDSSKTVISQAKPSTE